LGEQDTSRLSAKTRNSKPNAAVTKTIQAAVLEVVSGFLRSGGFHHTGTIGTERENPVQKFFKEHIPGKFTVCRGEAVDLHEKHSPQMDVIIFDSQNNYAFVSGDSLLLPAEALLVSIEVKTKLDKQEIEKALNSARKLRELRPFKKPLASLRSGGEPANDQCRYFHCLFAFLFLVGLVALVFYRRKRRLGMSLIAVAFLVSAFLGLLNGITVHFYLVEQGWTIYFIGLFNTVVGLSSAIIFTILVLLGLYFLHKETT